MLSRSLLSRLSPLRLSQVCSRSLSSSRLARPAWYAISSHGTLRRFSAAPAFRAENRVDPSTARAPSGTCYIANIPYNVTAEQLKDAFSEFGKVESVRLRTSHFRNLRLEADPLSVTSNAGLSRGLGFVQFGSVAEAVRFVEAHEADPIFVLDRQILVQHAQGTRNGSKSVEPSDTLMMLNLQGESEAEVRAMFGGFGDHILAVRFRKSRVFFRFSVCIERSHFLRRPKGGGPCIEKSLRPVPQCGYRDRSYGCPQEPE